MKPHETPGSDWAWDYLSKEETKMRVIFLHKNDVLLIMDCPDNTRAIDLAYETDLLAIQEKCAGSDIKVELVSPFRTGHTALYQPTEEFVSLRGGPHA
jgi:hypothetical protein